MKCFANVRTCSSYLKRFFFLQVVIPDSNKASDKMKIKDVLQEVSKNYTDEKFKTLVSENYSVSPSGEYAWGLSVRDPGCVQASDSVKV